MRSALFASSLLLLAACGGSSGTDMGTPDAGAHDEGVDAPLPDLGTDATPPYDSGTYLALPPDVVCPGGPDCPDTGDGMLYAGAAREEITASTDPATVDMIATDVNGDGVYELDQGDTYTDANHNGVYDGAWIAGFDNARGATGVHDPEYASALALRYNGTTIVFLVVDCVGYFIDEMDKIRAQVRTMGVDVDLVEVSATHSHEARDTVGLWGVTDTQTGIDPAYMDHIVQQGALAVQEAVAALEPAHVQYASTKLRDEEGGVNSYHGDLRDPDIIDDELRVMRFMRASDMTTISTLVNWGSHPEYTGPHNTLLSSDYPNAIRHVVENGTTDTDFPDGLHTLPGVGGITVFHQGALGCQIGPNGIHPHEWDNADPTMRTPIPDDNFEQSQVVGKQIGYFVLKLLGPTGGSVTDDTAALAFHRRFRFLDLENIGFRVAYGFGIFVRMAYNYDPSAIIRPGNLPQVLTEVSVIDVGRARILTVPGELDPALFIGGYDGSDTPTGLPIIDPTNPNPPDLTMAPAGPYLREIARASRPGVDYVWLFGLSEDYLGYFVLPFDFKVDPADPYMTEPPGDHYEETRAIGPHGWPALEGDLRGLLGGSPDAGM